MPRTHHVNTGSASRTSGFGSSFSSKGAGTITITLVGNKGKYCARSLSVLEALSFWQHPGGELIADSYKLLTFSDFRHVRAPGSVPPKSTDAPLPRGPNGGQFSQPVYLANRSAASVAKTKPCSTERR